MYFRKKCRHKSDGIAVKVNGAAVIYIKGISEEYDRNATRRLSRNHGSSGRSRALLL